MRLFLLPGTNVRMGKYQILSAFKGGDCLGAGKTICIAVVDISDRCRFRPAVIVGYNQGPVISIFVLHIWLGFVNHIKNPGRIWERLFQLTADKIFLLYAVNLHQPFKSFFCQRLLIQINICFYRQDYSGDKAHQHYRQLGGDREPVPYFFNHRRTSFVECKVNRLINLIISYESFIFVQKLWNEG